VAGYNAFDYFHRRYPGQVIGTRRAGNVLLSGPAIEGCDSYDADAMQRLFERYQFASVLSCEAPAR
jgi:dTDP-4-dehydrorhamnose reductase